MIKCAAALRCGLAAMASFIVASAFAADAYPAKQIRIIVPFGTSSGLDPVARAIGERMAEQMATPVVIENREGAGGQLGVLAAAAAPADGSTIVLVVSPPFAAAPYLQKRPAYDPVANFTPIARVVTTPLMLIASNHAPFKTFADMVDYARLNPGKLNYASAGIGTASHLKMEQLKLALGLDIAFVPYKSTGQQMTDTIGGQVQLSMPSLAGGLPQVTGGNVRALAVGSLQRSPLLPDVPTFAEASRVPELEAVVWYGFMAPRGLSEPLVARLSAEIEKALASSQMAKVAASMGAERAFQGPADFAATLQRSADEARKLIGELKIAPQDDPRLFRPTRSGSASAGG